MPAPAISGQVLSDYSITTEESTVATAVVTNTPTWVVVVINNIPFRMLQYSGTTYKCEIFGYDIGTLSAGTVSFMANNSSGGDLEVAASTLTVTTPTLSTFGIGKVIERAIYLIKTPSEYGGNQKLTEYNVVKDLDGSLFDGKGMPKSPILWIHALRDTSEPRSMDETTDILTVPIQFTIIRPVSDNTNTDVFYDTEAALLFLFDSNPNLQIDQVRF